MATRPSAAARFCVSVPMPHIRCNILCNSANDTHLVTTMTDMRNVMRYEMCCVAFLPSTGAPSLYVTQTEYSCRLGHTRLPASRTSLTATETHTIPPPMQTRQEALAPGGSSSPYFEPCCRLAPSHTRLCNPRPWSNAALHAYQTKILVPLFDRYLTNSTQCP